MVNFFSLPTFFEGKKKHGERSKQLIPCTKERLSSNKIFFAETTTFKLLNWYQLPNNICWTLVPAAIKITSL